MHLTTRHPHCLYYIIWNSATNTILFKTFPTAKVHFYFLPKWKFCTSAEKSNLEQANCSHCSCDKKLNNFLSCLSYSINISFISFIGPQLPVFCKYNKNSIEGLGKCTTKSLYVFKHIFKCKLSILYFLELEFKLNSNECHTLHSLIEYS